MTTPDDATAADFPVGFLWGASTAGHQVDGGDDQWSAWERVNAERLAADSGPVFAERLARDGDARWTRLGEQAAQPSNYLSGNGIEHDARRAGDFALLRELNLDAFRFGLEWSRLEPRPGEWDAEAIAHYRDYLGELRELGITPVPTIWHWTMPTWFTDRGGFARRENLGYFHDLVALVAREFAPLLDWLIVLNEPNVYTATGYLAGIWPPQHRDVREAAAVYRNLARAHRDAYETIKAVAPSVRVGIAMNLDDPQPRDAARRVDRLVARARGYAWNWWFLNRVRDRVDFVGVNFYMTKFYDRTLRSWTPGEPHSDMDWFMRPAALGVVLREVWRRYRLPILVTENGVADAEDTYRQWWLAETLTAMAAALRDGVDLRGYLHWSLLDNFEWASGWWPRFGLIAVDRATLQRTPRPSARWFAERVKHLRR